MHGEGPAALALLSAACQYGKSLQMWKLGGKPIAATMASTTCSPASPTTSRMDLQSRLDEEFSMDGPIIRFPPAEAVSPEEVDGRRPNRILATPTVRASGAGRGAASRGAGRPALARRRGCGTGSTRRPRPFATRWSSPTVRPDTRRDRLVSSTSANTSSGEFALLAARPAVSSRAATRRDSGSIGPRPASVTR